MQTDTTMPPLIGKRLATAPTGLHGHRLGTEVARAVAAEFVGTFVLVLAIIATVIPAALGEPVAGGAWESLAVPLAGGFALIVVVAGLGHISGAHVNPAVTVALAVTRRFPWRDVPAYVLAQLGGAVVAALAAWAIDGWGARTVADLGATGPAGAVGAGRVLLTEAIVTFILVLVVISVATDPRVPRAGAALAIGLALAVAIFIAGPVTGAGVNPARALGPMLVAGEFVDWWAYLAGPILGGSLAAVLYEYVFRKGGTTFTNPAS
ncbi:MIP/aquaporin family protein [Winogradskya consettensis]|uniref:Glycerol uptake facilitator protein n=1 Tax=Winogradskya consettensis TaxID=113560 RepID=A0A919W4X0_9ACTN|nr:aquaporin [Actinoplanes consettensis]GIM79873.1 glycerol uptake facilitator protein [Actinoplanes consettensis]